MSVALRFLFPSLFIALCCARIGATQDSTNYRALVESYRRNGGDEIDRVLRVRREVIDRAVDDALSAPAGWAMAAFISTQGAAIYGRDRSLRPRNLLSLKP